MAEGNRKDPRARVLNMTVRYKSATVDEFIENHSHDISRGGIFIKTRSPFPAGTLLKFEVRIAEDQKLMQGVGRVVWRREPERAEENYPAGMGIKFIKTGEGAAELISQIVAARQGAESSFDAGVRESGVPVSGPPPTSLPAVSGPAISADSSPPRAPASSPADSDDTPALAVESGPRSWTQDAETTVTSPAKKRPDQAPDKRKVVLQGSALEGPPSSAPKAAAPTMTIKSEDRAPARAHSPRKGSLAEETTSPRVRPAAALSGAPQRPASPSVYGLVAIVGALTLGVVLLNRVREDEPAEPAPESPVVAAPTPPPVVTKPVPREAEVVELAEPAVAATDLEPAAPAVEVTAPAASPPAVPPTPPAPAAAAPGTASQAPRPVPAVAAAASKPVSAPVAAKAQQPAPARPPPPVPPKPLPAEPPQRAAAPPPPVPKVEPSSAPAPAPQPTEGAPAAAASSEKAPAEKKKPATTAEARPREPSAPPAAAPAPAAPAPPASPTGDDNPY
jgi:uncharacterized protein (TIGR02266 family)